MADKIEYTAGDRGLPGGDYRLLDATLEQRPNGRWRFVLVEQWGSNQVYLEQHGRLEAIGRGDTPDEAAADARAVATEMEFTAALVGDAISHVLDEAEDATDAGFRLLISTDNAAFEDAKGEEVARILRTVADQVESGQGSGKVYDVNGNAVGEFRFE